jgi:hypothetical protein
MKGHSASTLLKAAENADWQQVVLNGGPPCFHLFGERFCLRAERWAGHGSDHEYASLHSLLAGVDAKERWIGALCAGLQLCNDQRRQYRDALKTARPPNEKEGTGEQQSDASEPNLNAEGQIAELSYAALRERDRADKAESEIAALQSRLERAEQDAKRYQWLRHQATFGRYAFGDPPAYRWKFPHIIDNRSGPQLNDFDAIDAAIDQALGSKE